MANPTEASDAPTTKAPTGKYKILRCENCLMTSAEFAIRGNTINLVKFDDGEIWCLSCLKEAHE